MMLTAIYYMFSTGETFAPYDINDFDKPKNKKQVLNTTNTLEYLKNLGLDISSIENQLNNFNENSQQL